MYIVGVLIPHINKCKEEVLIQPLPHKSKKFGELQNRAIPTVEAGVEIKLIYL